MNTMFNDLTDEELSKKLKDYAEYHSGEIADLTYAAGLRIAAVDKSQGIGREKEIGNDKRRIKKALLKTN